MSSIIPDGTLVWFDRAVLTTTRSDAPFAGGRNVAGLTVGAHPAEGAYIYARVPTNTPPRYIHRRYVQGMNKRTPRRR